MCRFSVRGCDAAHGVSPTRSPAVAAPSPSGQYPIDQRADAARLREHVGEKRVGPLHGVEVAVARGEAESVEREVYGLAGVHDQARREDHCESIPGRHGPRREGREQAVRVYSDRRPARTSVRRAEGEAQGAAQIWSELSEHRTLSEFLTAYDRLPPPEEQPLRRLVERLVFPLSDTSILPMQAAANRETVYVMDAASDPRVPPELREALEAEEFVVAPMVVQDKVIDHRQPRCRAASTSAACLSQLNRREASRAAAPSRARSVESPASRSRRSAICAASCSTR